MFASRWEGIGWMPNVSCLLANHSAHMSSRDRLRDFLVPLEDRLSLLSTTSDYLNVMMSPRGGVTTWVVGSSCGMLSSGW
jgi:hypothetical protein